MICVQSTLKSFLRPRFTCISIISNAKMSFMPEEVLLNTVGDKGVIVLNRPKALNALNLHMIRQIYPTLNKWRNEKTLVLIKGTGDKAFCAGGDVVAVTKAGKEGDTLTQDFFREEYQLNNLIGSLKIPYVALIHGITMGGGVGLSVHGRYRVATEKTLFAMPETAIGLFPDVGGSFFLPRLGGSLGMYLALTGDRLKGEDVVHAGIATHFCHTSLLAELEKSILENPASQIDAILHSYMEQSSQFMSHTFSLSPFMTQINAIFSATSAESIITQLAADKSKWAQDTLGALAKMSPTSLKITFKVLEEGKSKTLGQCLEMEYRLTQECCKDHDFYEGVRSLLIDKDQKPQWKPASLSEVTESTMQRYFSTLPDKEELKLNKL